MKVTSKLLTFSILLAAGTLGLGYALAGLWLGIVLIIMLGILWLRELKQKRDWPASGFLVCFVGLAVGGIHINAGAGWMLLGLIATLSAWDLHHFFLRLAFVQESEVMKKLEHAHLRRLLIVNCLGLGLAGVALTLKIEIGFGAALLLTAIAIVCLSYFIGSLRRESD